MLSPVKLFAESFSENSNLDDSFISSSYFAPRTNLKLHNLPVTSNLVKNLITNLGSSNASGFDWISIVLRRTVSLNFSAYLLNSSLCVRRKLIFQIVGWHHLWPLYLRTLVRGPRLKTTAMLVFFPW